MKNKIQFTRLEIGGKRKKSKNPNLESVVNFGNGVKKKKKIEE